jgi:hypothetical protein
MPEHAEESAECNWLLAFPTESGGKPPESSESLPARVERLEQALDRSTREIESLKSELATLVGTVDDIGKNARRPVAWAPRQVSTRPSRLVTVTAAVVFGVALGLIGWALWPRETIATIDTIDPTVSAAEPAPKKLPAAPVANELPVEPPSRPQPVVSLAAAITPPVTQPAPTVRERQPTRTPVSYVGTLSIDSAPGGAVFIDREAAGQTPLRAQNLKAGSHLVWIEREGYRRFTRVVHVQADRVIRVWADLEPLPER